MIIGHQPDSHLDPARLLAAIAVLAVVAGSALLTPTSVSACSFPPPESVAQELAGSEAVFSGEVIEILGAEPDGHITANFAVDEAWKGISQQEVAIETPADAGGGCGFQFDEGESYLVYAYERDGNLSSDICTRTALLSLAGEDLAVLGQGTSAEELDPVQENDEGLDLVILFGGLMLFVVIITAITALRLWK